MQIEVIQSSKNKKLAQWLRRRLFAMYARDTVLWRFAIGSMWLLSCIIAAITGWGIPTGFGAWFDITTILILNAIAMFLLSISLTIIFSLIGLRVPRLTLGSLIYLSLILYFLFYFSQMSWIEALVFSTVISGIALGLGLFVGAMLRFYSIRRLLLVTFMVAAAMIIVYAALWFSLIPGVDTKLSNGPVTINNPKLQSLSGMHLDPSKPGEYSYSSFTYGSGKDKHRPEFAEEEEERSISVDASAYIKNWPWLREKFWGFDKSQLPLNGRVWMPVGEGPFPIVFLVHGNHLMEKFSDEGYSYLGELLASRGIVSISIDENFLNYSVWSGIPEQDMKLRAWLLLKHIGQIQQFNKQAGSQFYGRIDFEQLALLGHSRGGQAAAMAADRSVWFANDLALPDMDSYSIQAVIALAPTDTWVDGKQAALQDISYLTLQGAKDTDLINFYGDRQYGRVKFSGNAEQFKASLYIEDANHSQFNTSWGKSDNDLPASLFIHPTELLEAEQQRQVAQVYVSAFLETVFHGSEQFKLLFRDYRYGYDLLPETRYYNQYESSAFLKMVDFQGDDRKLLSSGVTAEAVNMTEWLHTDALDRQGKGKKDKAVELMWHAEGSYSIHLSPASISNVRDEDILMFSLANMGGVDLSIDLEVEDSAGHAVRLSLNRFMETVSQVETDFIWLPGLETLLFKGKFKDEEEPVYQTYEIPLRAFQEINTLFNPIEWNRITFYFNKGPGKLMLDDLGFMPGK